MKVELEIDIEEGDIIKFNDEVWEVTDINMGAFTLESQSGSLKIMRGEDLQRNILLSGRFTRLKESYVDVF